MVVGWLVQRAENVAANDDHGESKPADAVRVGEDRPSIAEVVSHGLQHGKFRNDEDDGDDGSNKERDALKDKVCPILADLDHEDPATCGGGHECDDACDSKELKDEESNAPKGFEKAKKSENHGGVFLSCESGTLVLFGVGLRE